MVRDMNPTSEGSPMPAPTLETLPDDPAQLKHLIIEMFGTLQQQMRRAEKLQHHLEQLLRQHYGPRSEREDPNQARLFDVGEEPEPAVVERVVVTRRRKGSHGRKPLPKDLPRRQVEYRLEEDKLPCPCCGTKRVVFGTDVTEQLEYIPSSLFVLEHIRYKYACRSCEGEVAIADKPPQPIEKGLPGPGLLAHVVVSKYADHLPLHRQEEILGRQGVDISRKTMCDWVRDVAEQLRPVTQAMRTEVLASRVVHTDDTIVPVQDRQRTKMRKARLWVYIGDPEHPHTVYDYTPNRKRDGPARVLEEYEGYLQADAYGGYDGIYAGGAVTEVACWAHARRKFFDAKSSDSTRAHAALAFIWRLYEIEREAKGLDDDARKALRQERSVPILEEFEEWMKEESKAVLPKSPLAQAIGYADGQWEALCRFTEDGVLAIDNNIAERALRRVAIGRKNWMFAGSDAGGRWAAVIYSIIATCKDHGVDPFEYIRDILIRINTHPQSRIRELLPDRWPALLEAEKAAEHASASSS